MDQKVAAECSTLSDEEKITFPEVIQRLMKAGIESYYTDMLSLTKTYYQNNEAFTVSCSLRSKKHVAEKFHIEKVIDAIRQIQANNIGYQQFLREIMDAGVISYFVFIDGRQVVYYGRKGEQHVEKFPGT